MLTHFATVFVFLVLGAGLILVTQAISSLLRPHKLHDAKQRVYECGEEAEGSPWVRFNVRFYLVALFFIIFDVELVFMLPWAVVFKEMLGEIGILAFVEMAIFVAILVVGLAYVWRKGDLDWVKTLAPRERDELRPLSRYSSPPPQTRSDAPGMAPGLAPGIHREMEGADVK